MPDKIQVGPGSRFNFSLKIHKTATASQKARWDPCKTYIALSFVDPNAR